MQAKKKHTNRLIDETSPYLQQHAHNPVDWYPWGEEAFARAKAEDKPVLVSIGYSACHWCHVMEHESFEDESTAAIMNEHFVNIKVDMEERPDIDQIYMNFVQLTTGRGGWPMNVFVTPDKLPFFGGTYFPPDRRYNIPSWQQVLVSIADAYRDKRDELARSANDILDELRRVGEAEFAAAGLSPDVLDTAFESFVRTFDGTNGGFGGAPKFPQAMPLEFLLRYHKRTGNEKALEMVRLTCEKMANGGMYDQLGGGFHRYSVDAVWLVPHFEKMLYDNAQLARVYTHLYQITQDEHFKWVAIEILEYVQREMLDAGGGFYSTQDADSEGEEGKFFVWTPEEITKILGEDDAKLFNFYYDVSDEGNFEGENILHVSYSIEAAARALKITPEDFERSLETSRAKLFAEREKRIKPFRDEKVLAAWNGLMLAAFAEASAVYARPDFRETAEKNARFLKDQMIVNGRVFRSWKDGKAKLNGYLEDYANVADGLVELYQVSGRSEYIEQAKELADAMIAEFWDEENGGFFFTSNDHEELIVRSKDYFDNATPSGNSAAADVFLKLSRILGDDRYERFAVTVLRLASPQLRRYPGGFGRTLSALEFHFSPKREVVIIGAERAELEAELWRHYLPDTVVVMTDDPLRDVERSPLLEGRSMIDGRAAAYVCEDNVCQRPVSDIEQLREQLEITTK